MNYKLDYILELYSKHRELLIESKNFSLSSKKRCNFKPMFDDLENEITFLLNVENKPDKIVEFSPAYGWSTITLCLAVKNNKKGKVYTYDIQDQCVSNLNEIGLTDFFVFKKGNVLKEFVNFFDADYIFIDSDHSDSFARNYINNLIKPILNLNKKTIFCIHDVFHINHENAEGNVVKNFLETNNIPHFSPIHNFDILNKHRKLLGIDIITHDSFKNPSVFFNF